MDVVLSAADHWLFDRLYAAHASQLPRDSIVRQSLSLYTITLVGITVLYFTFATFSYFFVFDHRMMKHPRFHKNQVRSEISESIRSFMPVDLLTLPWFVGEVRGHSYLYNNVADIKGWSIDPLVSALGLPESWNGVRVGGGWTYIAFSCMFFLWFTDVLIYFIHRAFHHPLLYKHIHKPHHRWIIPTPFASHAFHPLDGYAQSLPYHTFVFLFPLHKFTYIALFIFVNLWTIIIHDGEMIVDHPLEDIINGPSHHTLHHLYFNCNYGQYFTWADKAGGSYRQPAKGEDPLLVALQAKENRLKSQSQVHFSPPTPASLSLSSTPADSTPCSSSEQSSEHSDLEAEVNSLLAPPRQGTLRNRNLGRNMSRGGRRLSSSSVSQTLNGDGDGGDSSAGTSVDGDDETEETTTKSISRL